MNKEMKSKLKYAITITMIGIVISLAFLLFEIYRKGNISFWAIILICNLVIMFLNLYYLDD